MKTNMSDSINKYALLTEASQGISMTAKYFGTNFSKPHTAYDKANRTISNYPVIMLINNAGIDGTKVFKITTRM